MLRSCLNFRLLAQGKIDLTVWYSHCLVHASPGFANVGPRYCAALPARTLLQRSKLTCPRWPAAVAVQQRPPAAGASVPLVLHKLPGKQLHEDSSVLLECRGSPKHLPAWCIVVLWDLSVKIPKATECHWEHWSCYWQCSKFVKRGEPFHCKCIELSLRSHTWASATVPPRPSAETSAGARPCGLGTFHKTR